MHNQARKYIRRWKVQLLQNLGMLYSVEPITRKSTRREYSVAINDCTLQHKPYLRVWHTRTVSYCSCILYLTPLPTSPNSFLSQLPLWSSLYGLHQRRNKKDSVSHSNQCKRANVLKIEELPVGKTLTVQSCCFIAEPFAVPSIKCISSFFVSKRIKKCSNLPYVIHAIKVKVSQGWRWWNWFIDTDLHAVANHLCGFTIGWRAEVFSTFCAPASSVLWTKNLIHKRKRSFASQLMTSLNGALQITASSTYPQSLA